MQALLLASTLLAAPAPSSALDVTAALRERLPALTALYKELHAAPELSLREERTAARLAELMRKLGYEVTEKVGGTGIVATLANGAGPRVLVRCDMDALPVEEQTGLPYASHARATLDGKEVPVMHACGHDMHMTVWLGTAEMLARSKDAWKGTLVFLGQPAEEKGAGAKAMLADQLYERFGKPDACLALHMSPAVPVGSVGVCPGYALATAESCDIVVQGRGGHGSTPHLIIDPIVLASKIVLGLQTVISREKDPRQAGVITVGSIHGGLKHNIIPDQVALQLTLRSYDDAVHAKLHEGLERVCKGEALAAGAPAPSVTYSERTPSTLNDPALTERIRAVFVRTLGADHVLTTEPVMGAEDFSHFGRAGVPSLIFWLGAPERARWEEAQRPGATPLPSLHSSLFAPVPEAAIETGVRAMSAAALELLARS